MSSETWGKGSLLVTAICVDTDSPILTGFVEGKALVEVGLASVPVEATRALAVEGIGSVVTRGPV